MSRSIKAFCWVYASKKDIFKEWISGMVEGSFAVGKRYAKQKEMIKHYGFSISKNGRRCGKFGVRLALLWKASPFFRQQKLDSE